MAFRNLREYLQYVRQIVTKEGLVNQAYALDYDEIEATRGDIILVRDFVFRDGAKLNFYENILIRDGQVERRGYSFSYERADGFYFRYDKDPTPNRIDRYKHHICHLHANAEVPRYITHETSFEEIFRFILANYYE